MIHHSAVLLLSLSSIASSSLCLVFFFFLPISSYCFHQITNPNLCPSRHGILSNLLSKRHREHSTAYTINATSWRTLVKLLQGRSVQCRREERKVQYKLMYTACISWQNVLRRWTRVVHWQTRLIPLNNDSIMKHIRCIENWPCRGNQISCRGSELTSSFWHDNMAVLITGH